MTAVVHCKPVSVITDVPHADKSDDIDPLTMFDPCAAFSYGGQFSTPHPEVNGDTADTQANWKSYLPHIGPPASLCLSASACVFAPAGDTSSVCVEGFDCRNSTIAAFPAELEDLKKRSLQLCIEQKSLVSSHDAASNCRFCNSSQSMVSG